MSNFRRILYDYYLANLPLPFSSGQEKIKFCLTQPKAWNIRVEKLENRGLLLLRLLPFAVWCREAATHSLSRQAGRVLFSLAFLYPVLGITSSPEQEGIPVIMCSVKAVTYLPKRGMDSVIWPLKAGQEAVFVSRHHPCLGVRDWTFVGISRMCFGETYIRASWGFFVFFPPSVVVNSSTLDKVRIIKAPIKWGIYSYTNKIRQKVNQKQRKR